MKARENTHRRWSLKDVPNAKRNRPTKVKRTVRKRVKKDKVGV